MPGSAAGRSNPPKGRSGATGGAGGGVGLASGVRVGLGRVVGRLAGRVVVRALAFDFRAADLRAVLFLAVDFLVDLRAVDFLEMDALRALDLRVAAAFRPAAALFGDFRVVVFLRPVDFFAVVFRVLFRAVDFLAADFRAVDALRARDLRVAAAFRPAAALFGDFRAVDALRARDLRVAAAFRPAAALFGDFRAVVFFLGVAINLAPFCDRTARSRLQYS